VLAQRGPFVLAAEPAPSLQQGDDLVDEIR